MSEGGGDSWEDLTEEQLDDQVAVFVKAKAEEDEAAAATAAAAASEQAAEQAAAATRALMILGGRKSKKSTIVGSGNLIPLGKPKQRVQADVRLGDEQVDYSGGGGGGSGSSGGGGAAVLPVLVVNWSRIFYRHVSKLDYSPTHACYSPAARNLLQHASDLGSDGDADGSGDGGTPSPVLAAVQAAVEDAFEADAEGTSEQMFAAGECFHATTETADQVIADVAAMFPGSCVRTLAYVGAPRGPLHGGRSTGGSQIFFILTCAHNIDGFMAFQRYPSTLWSGETPSSAWETVARAAIWPCVTVLKRHVAGCCRGLKWKLLMCMEIENLAIQQQMEDPQRALSAILGRPEFDEEVLDDEGEQAPPTLPTRPEDMSVVDLIVAMASDRMPPIAQDTTAQSHMEGLVAKHLEIRAEWEKTFGSFPDAPFAFGNNN